MKKKRFLSPLWDLVLRPQKQKGWGKSLSCSDEFERDRSLSSSECVVRDNCPYLGALWVTWDDVWQKCLPAFWSVWQRGCRARRLIPGICAMLQWLLCLGSLGDQHYCVIFPYSHGDVLSTLDQGTRHKHRDLGTLLSSGHQDRGQRKESDGFAAGCFLRRCWAAVPSVQRASLSSLLCPAGSCTYRMGPQRAKREKNPAQCKSVWNKITFPHLSGGWGQTLGVAEGTLGMWSLVLTGKPRALLSLGAGRVTQSSSRQPAASPGLLPAFPPACVSSAWQPLSTDTAYVTWWFLMVKAERTWAGCCEECGIAIPGGCGEHTGERERGPISLYQSKSSCPTNKTKESRAKGGLFSISNSKIVSHL